MGLLTMALLTVDALQHGPLLVAAPVRALVRVRVGVRVSSWSHHGLEVSCEGEHGIGGEVSLKAVLEAVVEVATPIVPGEGQG